MTLDQAFLIVKKASEAAPMPKESHVMVEQALKLIADLIDATMKEKTEKQG